MGKKEGKGERKQEMVKKINNNVYISVEINDYAILKTISFLTMDLYTLILKFPTDFK